MTVTQTRQTFREWITNLRQSKGAPAEKLAEVQQRKRDKTDQLQKVLASSEQAILEKELADLAAEEVALVPEVKAAALAAYQRKVKEWEIRLDACRQEIAEALLATEAKLGKMIEVDAERPRPPAGVQDNDFYFFSNGNQIYGIGDGLCSAGVALNLFERGGDGFRPRLTPKVPSTQVWGEPLGSKGK
jgi:hypothetical protein